MLRVEKPDPDQPSAQELEEANRRLRELDVRFSLVNPIREEKKNEDE